MKNYMRERILMPVFLVLMTAMVIAGFTYLMVQARTSDRALLVYNAGQAAAAAAEAYALQGTLSSAEVPQGLGAFGVYGSTGEKIFGYGKAPERLPPVMLSESESDILPDGETVRVVRPFGGPGFAAGRATSDGSLPGMMRAHRGVPGQGRITLYALYASPGQLAAQRVRNTILLLVGILFFLLAASAYGLYRRVARYREDQENQRQMVQLGEAARTLAHEIKNPLGAIRLQQAILQRSAPTELHGSVAIIGEEVKRIATLTDRVREFLRNPRGSPARIDLGRLVREIAARQEYPVNVSVDDEPCIILVDAERIHSVVVNLMNNAWESMHPQDQDTTNDDLPTVEVIVERGRHSVRLRVRDRGAGIPAEIQKRIYDPFFTTKERGTGVGLAITRSFVEGAGGSVTLRNNPDGGTEFLVEFPEEM
jgi:signal transduction histidine kinase